MAILKWRKTEHQKGKFGNDYIVWRKGKKDRISVWGLTTGLKNPQKRATKNNVKKVWEVKKRKFKTKKQALNYAKNYMRKK